MKQRDLLFLLISSVILTIAWIVFTIIHKSISSTIASVTNEQITAIKPDFDEKTITILKNRQNTAPAYSIQSPTASSSGIILTPTVAIPTPTRIPTGPVSLITSTPNNSNQNQATGSGKTSQ